MEAFEEFSNSKKSRADDASSFGPLYGVVACLTGFSNDDKVRLHEKVQQLGGRCVLVAETCLAHLFLHHWSPYENYFFIVIVVIVIIACLFHRCTREFNVQQNTHLIAKGDEGAKYELAVSDPRIKIVTSSWLESCEKLGTRVNEALHAVPKKPSQDATDTRTAKKPSAYLPLLHQIVQQQTNMTSSSTSSLFEFHQFYLLGFENDPETKDLLSKVIRRGHGTIHWELSNDITLLIVHDTCHEILRCVDDIETSWDSTCGIFCFGQIPPWLTLFLFLFLWLLHCIPPEKLATPC